MKHALALAAALIATMPSIAAPINLTVHPDTAVVVNGYAEIPDVFGMAVNGSLMSQMTAEARELNIDSARSYCWPLYGSMPVTPWWGAQYGTKAIKREDVAAAWDKWYSQDFDANIGRDFVAGAAQSAQINQLRQFSSWGVTKHLVFQPMQPDGYSAQHIGDVDRYFRAYVDQLHKAAPTLDIDYVQFTNEPNYSQWSGQFATTKEAVDTWLSVFNTLDSYMRKNRPTTTMLGPCLASDVAHSWSGWNEWTVPFLKRANDVRVFNYHLYDIGAQESLAWMEMRQAEAEQLRGVRTRAIITETNSLYDKLTRPDLFLWHAQHLFSQAANPDKFAMRHYFLMAYLGRDDLFTCDKRGKYTPNNTYWLYWALNQTRGKRVAVTGSLPAGVKSLASMPAPDRLVVSLLNDTDAAVDINVSPGAEAHAATSRYVWYAAGSLVHGDEAAAGNGSSVNAHIEPRGVRSIIWTLPKPTTVARVLRETEYFLPVVARPIDDGATASVHASRLPGKGDDAFLRLGVYTDDPLSAHKLTATFNGAPVSVAWSSLQPDLSPGRTVTTWFVEIAVPPGSVRADNMVKFPAQDADYKLMFASLVVRDRVAP